MKSLEESITTAMESRDIELVPFFPYILQDFWELGTPAETVIELVQRHYSVEETTISICHCELDPQSPKKPNADNQGIAGQVRNDKLKFHRLRVLDLGCGKGAVSVKLAAALKCNCLGIDGIPEFIEISKKKAHEYGVENLCRFEVGDIRKKIEELGKFDVIILGAIGQVFGDYFSTLTTLSKHLETEGIIIINDAYIEDSSSFIHPQVFPRKELLKQIMQAGMEIVDEHAGGEDHEEYVRQFENIQKRCKELIVKYPDKISLFENYIKTQAEEYDALENKMIGSIMVLKKI